MTEHQLTLDRRKAVARILADRGDALLITGLGSPTWDVAAAGDQPVGEGDPVLARPLGARGRSGVGRHGISFETDAGSKRMPGDQERSNVIRYRQDFFDHA